MACSVSLASFRNEEGVIWPFASRCEPKDLEEIALHHPLNKIYIFFEPFLVLLEQNVNQMLVLFANMKAGVIFKGTLMQIWRSANVFALISK